MVMVTPSLIAEDTISFLSLYVFVMQAEHYHTIQLSQQRNDNDIMSLKYKV